MVRLVGWGTEGSRAPPLSQRVRVRGSIYLGAKSIYFVLRLVYAPKVYPGYIFCRKNSIIVLGILHNLHQIEGKM